MGRVYWWRGNHCHLWLAGESALPITLTTLFHIPDSVHKKNGKRTWFPAVTQEHAQSL